MTGAFRRNGSTSTSNSCSSSSSVSTATSAAIGSTNFISSSCLDYEPRVPSFKSTVNVLFSVGFLWFSPRNDVITAPCSLVLAVGPIQFQIQIQIQIQQEQQLQLHILMKIQIEIQIQIQIQMEIRGTCLEHKDKVKIVSKVASRN